MTFEIYDIHQAYLYGYLENGNFGCSEDQHVFATLSRELQGPQEQNSFLPQPTQLNTKLGKYYFPKKPQPQHKKNPKISP